jgi:predicted  nucleic acid-binding Zn-ribbon protein
MATTKTTSSKPSTKPAAEETEEDDEEEEGSATPAPDTEDEEAAASDGVDDDDESNEEETVDEDLFAALPIMPKGAHEMELTKCASRIQTSEDREDGDYRSGIEYAFEPDRSEHPDAGVVKVTVWARFFSDDKPGFKDMNRRLVKQFREAGLFPEPCVLTGKPGVATKRVKFDYDEPVGGMFKVGLGVEEYQGEKRNRINAIKAL